VRSITHSSTDLFLPLPLPGYWYAWSVRTNTRCDPQNVDKCTALSTLVGQRAVSDRGSTGIQVPRASGYVPARYPIARSLSLYLYLSLSLSRVIGLYTDWDLGQFPSASSLGHLSVMLPTCVANIQLYYNRYFVSDIIWCNLIWYSWSGSYSSPPTHPAPPQRSSLHRQFMRLGQARLQPCWWVVFQVTSTSALSWGYCLFSPLCFLDPVSFPCCLHVRLHFLDLLIYNFSI
jgi:hypothetical protein